MRIIFLRHPIGLRHSAIASAYKQYYKAEVDMDRHGTKIHNALERHEFVILKRISNQYDRKQEDFLYDVDAPHYFGSLSGDGRKQKTLLAQKIHRVLQAFPNGVPLETMAGFVRNFCGVTCVESFLHCSQLIMCNFSAFGNR